LLGLRITTTFHWGFWVRSPFTSRYQASLTVPSPTTLIGALARPLFESDGEVYVEKKGGIRSCAARLQEAVVSASFYYAPEKDRRGYAFADINKYITLHYQNIVKTEPYMRRYSLKYRTGALQVGKISFPSAKGVACYLLDEENLKRIVGHDWRMKVASAAWNLTRMGSKESIVSVESVDVVETPRELTVPSEDKVKTVCYVPLRNVDVESLVGQKYYIERFWRGGWGRGDTPEYEDYIIPGERSPISSEPIEVLLKEGKAFELGPSEVLCF